MRLPSAGSRVLRACLSAATSAIVLFGMPGQGLAAQTVRVWADASAGGGPGISDGNHTITFGPAGKNLFFSQGGKVYTTTGPSGSTPGSFASLKNLPGFCGEDEGSAFLSLAGLKVLYVASDDCEETYTMPVTGMGGIVALGAINTIDGEDGDADGDVGDRVEFDRAEGVAILNGTPIFDDVHSTPMFATADVSPGVTVNGTHFPIVDQDWSGKTLLIVNEENPNLVALRVENDGAPITDPVALAQDSFTDSPDAVTTTEDGRFAYVHDESASDFYRFDLRHVDSSGGANQGHVKRFDFTNQTWLHSGLAVGQDNAVYATAEGPGGAGKPVALYRMAIDPAAGNLGEPRFVTLITAPGGAAATGSGSRITSDGVCLYTSDSGSDRIFQICSTDFVPAPVLSRTGLVLVLIALLSFGVWCIGRRRPSLPPRERA